MRKPYPENITLEARKALDSFTDEEIASLMAFYDDETSEFLGIGFINKYGKMCKFANKDKAESIVVLEEECYKELNKIPKGLFLPTGSGGNHGY